MTVLSDNLLGRGFLFWQHMYPQGSPHQSTVNHSLIWGENESSRHTGGHGADLGAAASAGAGVVTCARVERDRGATGAARSVRAGWDVPI
jgi:hypothetical protein